MDRTVASLFDWHPSRQKAAFVAALLSSISLLFAISAGNAKAGSSFFCSGTKVAGKSFCEGAARNMDELEGWGDQHSICVRPRELSERWQSCSSGPGVRAVTAFSWWHWTPVIFNQSFEWNVVHGLAFNHGPEEEAGGGGGGGGTESPPPPEWHTENLGGNVVGNPDIASWGKGRLDIFAVNSNGSLAQKAYIGGQWGNWGTLGSAGTFSTTGVGAIGSGGNNINVVGKSASTNEVLDEWWNGSKWQLVNFGGSIAGVPDMDAPLSGSRTDLWARGTNGHLMHRWWTGTEWAPWNDAGVSISSSPGATSWASNKTDVVSRASNGSIQDTWWEGGEQHNDNLGGEITGSPTIASWEPGRLDVFNKGMDGYLWSNWMSGGAWHSWHKIELGGPIASDPGVASWGPGRLDVVARLANGTIQHWWWEQG